MHLFLLLLRCSNLMNAAGLHHAAAAAAVAVAAAAPVALQHYQAKHSTPKANSSVASCS